MCSRPFLWLLALLVLAIAGCGGSRSRSDSLKAVWPTPGVYAVSKAPLSDGTFLTLQVGISSTPGKGGIRLRETAPGTAGHMGNMPFRNAQATNGALVVSGQPDEHTFVRNVPEYTYSIQEFQSKLVVKLTRGGRVETLRLDRIGDHAPKATKTREIASPQMSLMLNGGTSIIGRIIQCDTVWNSDYGDTYAKLLVYLEPDFLSTDLLLSDPNELASVGGFVVPSYYIGDNIINIATDDSNVGGYVVYMNHESYSSNVYRVYIQPNPGQLTLLVALHHSKDQFPDTDYWQNDNPWALTLSDNAASTRYPSTYTSDFIDVGSEVSIEFQGANPTLVGFTIDDTSAISSLLSGYTGDQIVWAGLSSNELPQTNPSNVWVSVLNSSALRPPNIGINLVGSVSLIRDASVYGY